MKQSFILFLFLALVSCNSSNNEELNEFERERAVIVNAGIEVSRSFKIRDGGTESPSSEIFYNEDGYVTKLVLHSEGMEPIVNEYVYDKDNIVVEIKEVNSEGHESTISIKEFFDNSEKEIDIEFRDQSVYKSVYSNDSLGRNIHKEYYRDSVLIGTYEFHWGTHTEPDSIVGYSPEAKKTNLLVNKFSNGNLVESTRHENSEIVELKRWKYNKSGQQIENFVEVVNDFTSILKISYEGDLVKNEVSTFTSTDGSYKATTETIWRHQKRKK